MRIFLVNKRGKIAAVIENHVELLTVRPENCLLDTPVVFFEGLTLPCEDRNPLCRKSGCRMILSGKDIATRPADGRSQFDQRFYQYTSLNCHGKAPRDTGPGKRLGGPKLRAKRHQSRHLRFGDLNFFSAKLS